MQKRNKELAHRWFEGAYNEGRVELADRTFASIFRLNGQVVGPDGPRRNVLGHRTAFPDVRAVVEGQVAEHDMVVTRWTATGTHLGRFLGLKPTGRTARVPTAVIWRIEDGWVVEDWTYFDRLAILDQLRG